MVMSMPASDNAVVTQQEMVSRETCLWGFWYLRKIFQVHGAQLFAPESLNWTDCFVCWISLDSPYRRGRSGCASFQEHGIHTYHHVESFLPDLASAQFVLAVLTPGY